MCSGEEVQHPAGPCPVLGWGGTWARLEGPCTGPATSVSGVLQTASTRPSSEGGIVCRRQRDVGARLCDDTTLPPTNSPTAAQDAPEALRVLSRHDTSPRTSDTCRRGPQLRVGGGQDLHPRRPSAPGCSPTCSVRGEQQPDVLCPPPHVLPPHSRPSVQLAGLGHPCASTQASSYTGARGRTHTHAPVHALGCGPRRTVPLLPRRTPSVWLGLGKTLGAAAPFHLREGPGHRGASPDVHSPGAENKSHCSPF